MTRRDLMEKLGQKIKTLALRGKEKGYLTYEELNDILPDDDVVSPERIDDILIMLDEVGIDLIDESEADSRDAAEIELEEEEEEKEIKKLTEEDIKNIKEEIALLKQMHELAKSIVKNSGSSPY